jgi:putative FmdB family regulatory protein
MPIYEYCCPACEKRFEGYVQSWRDALPCPSCGETETEKQLSTFALKGAEGPSPGACCGRGGCGCHS